MKKFTGGTKFIYFNVPLAETIQICADVLYSSEYPPAHFSRLIFVEVIEMAASAVEFSFDNIKHSQIDGVVMGTPPGPFPANIVVSYYECNLFQTTSKSDMYYRYTDVTFIVFSNENECELF